MSERKFWLTVWWILVLTLRGRVRHICVSKLIAIGSDNGWAPARRQAIVWTNDEIPVIGPLGTNFSGILIETHISSFKKLHLKMSSGKWRPSCLGLNVLISFITPEGISFGPKFCLGAFICLKNILRFGCRQKFLLFSSGWAFSDCSTHVQW